MGCPRQVLCPSPEPTRPWLFRSSQQARRGQAARRPAAGLPGKPGRDGQDPSGPFGLAARSASRPAPGARRCAVNPRAPPPLVTSASLLATSLRVRLRASGSVGSRADRFGGSAMWPANWPVGRLWDRLLGWPPGRLASELLASPDHVADYQVAPGHARHPPPDDGLQRRSIAERDEPAARVCGGEGGGPGHGDIRLAQAPPPKRFARLAFAAHFSARAKRIENTKQPGGCSF